MPLLLAATSAPVHAGMQSTFHAGGDQAARIESIAWVLFVGGGLIFIAVILLALFTLFGSSSQRPLLGRQALIVGGGIVFPVVVLTALLVYTFSAASAMVRDDIPPSVRIEVTGELWWWRVRYLQEDGSTLVETANEIRIPAGQVVEFLLTSPDIIHSFWVPGLAGKIDIIPGHVNRLRVTAQEMGTYRGQCAEYCGAQHANMALQVVVLTPDQFRTWLAEQQKPAPEPASPDLQLGRQLFLDNRCGLCHTVRGTPAHGKPGPELTHVGSRLALAAATLPNGAGSLAAWITGSQHIKPDNKMPAFRQFSPEELRALAAWLESLQ
ncbi:MAG TPA: cytochrome c oxidase subunit II [Noviherbaspirillum sp.]|nr:cytochrome c oxidase subunit II [Noviherbaspirillum sp.]